MKPHLGIRREDDARGERRTPLIPYHTRLLRHEGVDVTVQSSPLRAYTDAEYQNAGAAVHEAIDQCHVVFGVHPPAPEELGATTTIACLAQLERRPAALRPLLARLVETEGSLIDLAALRDDRGRPLVGFARHAGLAGCVDALWALGRRLKLEGHVTPLLLLSPSREYESVDAIRLAMMQVGRRINEQGFPAEVTPVVIGVTGGGPIAAAVQELLDCLPQRELAAEELPHAEFDPQLSSNRVFKVVFETHHLVEGLEARPVLASELANDPARYRSAFARYLPHLTALLHAAPWPARFPPLLVRDQLQDAWQGRTRPKLGLIADLTREEGESLCPLFPATTHDHPAYVYRPDSGDVDEALSGRGPVVLAPIAASNETARDASAEFGQHLLPFASALTWGVIGRRLDLALVPPAVRAAVVIDHGRFTEPFAKFDLSR